MRKAPAILLAILLLSTVFSCKKTDNYQVDYKYAYFPSDTGRYVIYDVDSVTFDGFYTPPKVDTVHFQLMELTESIFNDNSGRPTMRIERYRRADSTQAWTIWNVWTANRTTTTAERFEDNLRFIKLIFPPNTTTTWKGNSYLDINDNLAWMDDWDYQITELDAAKSINGLNFDSTLTVLQHDEENLIEKKYGQEVYAKNVGLVYRQLLHLKKDVTATFPEGSNDGFIYTMKVHAYGQQ